MILNIKERLVLSMIMEPQAGRFDALKLIRKFREELSFSEEEIKKIDLRIDEGKGYKWDPERSIEKDIPVGDVVLNMIKNQFLKLEREERLFEDHLDIYSRFVSTEETK